MAVIVFLVQFFFLLFCLVCLAVLDSWFLCCLVIGVFARTWYSYVRVFCFVYVQGVGLLLDVG